MNNKQESDFKFLHRLNKAKGQSPSWPGHRRLSVSCAALALLVIFLLGGCSRPQFQFQSLSLAEPYQDHFQQSMGNMDTRLPGFGSQLAVISPEDQNTPGYKSDDYTDLLINDSENKVLVSKDCFKKNYPASTTKIMTALLALERCDFDEMITLDHDIVMTEEGAVISTLSKGDKVSVDEVFHTMLIKSANDCAVILAEHMAGSEEKFAKMMNKRARKLGATHTHFVNSNGLHDDNHYTTAYDMYLIFKEALKYDRFVNTISTKSYQMTYYNERGQRVGEYMNSTNHFLQNEYKVPDGVIMFGGKTGTTRMARSCLILMTENEDRQRFISVILGAKTRDDLYRSMTGLLEKTVK